MANNMEGLGTMLAFLQQGSNPGQADPLPEMQAPPPLPQGGAPNLPQSGGGGMLKGILGNLVSGYVGNKLQTHMDNEAAKEQGATLTPIIAEHIKSLPENSPQRAFLTRTGNLIKSGNADNVKSGVTAFNNYYSSLADNFKQTSGQKELQDTGLQAEKNRLLNQGGVPQAFNRNDKGELVPATVAGTGQTYQQYQGGYVSPYQQKQDSIKNQLQQDQAARADINQANANERQDRATAKQERANQLQQWRLDNPNYEANQKQISDAEIAHNNLVSRANNLKEAMKGIGNIDRINPLKNKVLANAYQSLSWSVRDPQMQNTGVLNAGEIPMLEKAITDPTSVGIGGIVPVEELNKQIDALIKTSERGLANVRKSKTPRTQPPGAEPKLSPEDEAAYQDYLNRGGK
jgi:hypothetical protein